jgi:pectate lyase
VDNRNSGFYANHHLVGSDWLNNTAYRNGANFNLLGRLPDNKTDVPGSGNRLHNNLSYHSRGLIVQFVPEQNQASHNSFAMEMTLHDGDFESLDSSELQWPRQADGSLPKINFLHPAENSTVINRGADVGLPYRGTFPDLGAFERR